MSKLIRIVVFCIFMLLLFAIIRFMVVPKITLPQQNNEIIQEIINNTEISIPQEPETKAYTTEKETELIEFDPNDPNLPMPPIGKSTQEGPNALDVIAPQYNEAQKRLDTLKTLRQQGVKDQNNIINNIK